MKNIRRKVSDEKTDNGDEEDDDDQLLCAQGCPESNADDFQQTNKLRMIGKQRNFTRFFFVY